MAYLQEVETDWNTFKVLRTTLSSATLYYLQNDLQYVPFLVEEGTSPIVAQSLYYVSINRDPSAVSGPYAPLASGAKASKHIQDITYIANSYGTGGNSVTIEYVDTVAGAKGTVTVVDYTLIAGATVTVNGVVLTEGIEWTAAVDNDTTAASLASAITTATATTLCTAVAVATNVVTITTNMVGFLSNSLRISLVTSDAINLITSGSLLTGGEGGAGYEYVVVSGNAITVHITSGVSTAHQVVAAVTGWNAYSGLPSYNSAASSALVSAVIDTGKEGVAQVVVGATPLANGIATVTVLSDWETNFKGSATRVTSFSNGVALEV